MEMSLPAGDIEQWGVSQGADFRRMDINDSVELTTTNCGEASGGFIGDSVITGNIQSCSQQQWYTRNTNFAGWTGNLWNMTFSGDNGAPAAAWGGGGNNYAVLATTPVVREKPFLYQDSSGNYWVFSPTLRTNSVGPSWTSTNPGPGNSLAVSTFFIATPSSTLAQINAALAAGQNLILTPGIYQYSGSINVTNPNTVVLGLGYADLVPQSGTAAMTVADVDGVQLAGFLIDAGSVNSPVLLQVGVKGASRVSHASNPTSISDVNFRIGGATAGTATIATEIDSDNVIIDNMWSWRADHGADAAWTGNVAMNGLVVNGDNVTALGLAVEHFEAEQVVWNGEGGETIFYQSEMPYDVPNQAAWMNGSFNGYASYYVSPSVTTHSAYGLGVYSFFNVAGVTIFSNSGISAPVATGVTFSDLVSVYLAGSGGITYTIASDSPGITDNAGTTAQSGSYISFVSSWGGSNGGCTAVPSVPGTPSGTGVSSSQINFTWGASTAGSSCTVSYNVFCSTTSGFTPSSSNEVASGLTSPSFSDTGLATATTYYCKIEAADGDGSSAASAQGSGATTGTGSCSAVPSAPTGLAATASSSSVITLNWNAVTPPANCTISSYSVYGGTSPNPTTLIASVPTGTSYSNTGLAASTIYYYEVKAVDTDGTSASSAQAQATTLANTSCSAAPLAPTGLATTASSSSVIGLNWNAVTPPANCTISSYTLYGSTTSGFTPGSGNLITSGLTSTSFSDTGLSASTTYYYVVEAVDSFGTSAASTQQSATTQALGSGTEIVAIAAGGPAQSNASGGDHSFVADEYFVGGGDNGAVTATINLAQPGANAAPMGVYQNGRAGVSTYTIPSLTAGSQYTVLLHFAETYFTAAGDREFNVAINGTTVLTNLDVYATVGKNAALLETFTATANSSGQIVIAFTIGAANQPLVMGIEIRSTSGGSCSAAPSAPGGLTATTSSSSAIGLTWNAVTPPANCTISSYSVYGSTTNGFTPSSSNLIATVNGTTYSSTGLAASTTYYYKVEANDASGASAASTQASAETSAASCSAVPSAPTGLTATASSSSAIGLVWNAVTPPANCSISSYSVYGSKTSGFTPSSSTLLASGVTGTTYSNTGLTASTTYYYVVEAVDADGNSVASAQQSATTLPSGSTEVVAIACGAPAESNSGGGDYSFVADEDFVGGGANSPVTATINLAQPGANAAPMAVYQHGRAGISTYTIPGLTAGATYTVLLHFAETYFTTAGSREFNVAINGTTVLTNLDVYGTVGKDAALLETFNTTANSSGQIVIAFTAGAANQPVVMGIEVRTN
jgi:fibronectin type 3 domain-containing protein